MEFCAMNQVEYCININHKMEDTLNMLINKIGCGLKYLHCLISGIIHQEFQPRNDLLKLDDHNNLI